MVRDFKFFDDNEEEFQGYDGASWMFGCVENLDQYRYDILHYQTNGIRSFLDLFPREFIVTILSITGPNGRVHNIDTNYNDGWGFDIIRDSINVQWVSFRP